MRWTIWVAVLSTILLIISCFLPWVFVPSREFMATGIDAGPALHKPAYTHFIFAAAYLVLTIIPQIWAKRINLVVAALNIAWAIRNFFVVTACAGGECPEKQVGIYLVLGSSIVMLLASFFPDIKIKNEETSIR